MITFVSEPYDAIVIGAGHAGCEAALACSRMGQKVLLLTLSLDGVAFMACNPSIGGTAKGHLVREIDALGGEMGRAIDDTYLQNKMLNRGKGPAVYSLRAQADKKAYQKRMLKALFSEPNLTLKQGEAAEILTETDASGKRHITGVVTTTGATHACRSVILCSGVYLCSRTITGEVTQDEGPSGLRNAKQLSQSLEKLGFPLRRFKTGTPARLDGRTIDFSAFEPQYGEEPPTPFSFLSDTLSRPQYPCYLGYTNETTHEIIRANLDRAPLYAGVIHGVGPRYCPSIEDKIVRFAERKRHQFFLEPEGENSNEWYAQGLSSSLPEEVQVAFYRSIRGLEHVQLLRLAYAIEYDCIDPTQLTHSLMARHIDGFFFAGQINGSSGYEEAAAQGLYAGINAVCYLIGKKPFLLDRSQAYIGVLVDDLVVKGTNEPYRMMTSRAEYRLLLRQDNADLRLTELGYQVGLCTEERYLQMRARRNALEEGLLAVQKTTVPAEICHNLLNAKTSADLPPNEEESSVSGSVHSVTAMKAADLIRRGVSYASILTALNQEKADTLPDESRENAEEIDIMLRYEGYIRRQEIQVQSFRKTESLRLPEDLDYLSLQTLRIEARQKLQQQRPETLGAASRISGVSPGDIAVLQVYLEKRRRETKLNESKSSEGN